MKKWDLEVDGESYRFRGKLYRTVLEITQKTVRIVRFSLKMQGEDFDRVTFPLTGWLSSFEEHIEYICTNDWLEVAERRYAIVRKTSSSQNSVFCELQR